jgi:folate-binding protein YgfZ
VLDLYRTLGAAIVPRDVVRVEGPDAVSYLQGQVSQDVADLDVGATTWTFVLQPTGKVDVWGRVTRTADDAFVFDVEAGQGEKVAARLQRFLLRTKAEITPLDWRCVALRGPGATEAAAEADVAAELRVPAGWPGVDGACLLGPDVALPPGIAVASPEAIEALRITSGVPAMGVELTERTIPAEAGQWVIDASVDFTKGCFTGQELVARIDSRGGNVPRNLRGLIVDSDTPPPPGATIRAKGSDGTDIGEVTSAAYSPAVGAAVALAYIGRAVTAPADAIVATASGDSPARILPLPLVESAVE